MKWSKVFLTELLHWGGLLLAVALIYTLLSAGKIPRATTGMVTMLLFALVTFLYGVHLDRRFLGVGIFLGLSYVVMSYLAAYIWILLLIAGLAVSVAIFMVKRVYSQQAATNLVTHDGPVTTRVTKDTTQEIGGVHL
jgi:membrane glycosyltransferase